MSLVAKVFVVLNLVVSVFFLAFAMNIWTAQTKWQKMYEHEKVVSTQTIVDAEKREIALAQAVVHREGEIANSRSENVTLKGKIGQLIDEKVKISTELEASKSKNDIMQAENQEVNREIRRAYDDQLKLKAVVLKAMQAVQVERDNAVKARNEKAEMENELNSTKQTLATLGKDKRSIEEELSSANRKIEKALSLGFPIFEGEAIAGQPNLDAQVLAVKSDLNLVMLSVGSQQNVRVGNQFTISRGDQFVSKVQVEKVYPDMCSAHVLPGMSKGDIQVHDDAKSR